MISSMYCNHRIHERNSQKKTMWKHPIIYDIDIECQQEEEEERKNLE